MSNKIGYNLNKYKLYMILYCFFLILRFVYLLYFSVLTRMSQFLAYMWTTIYFFNINTRMNKKFFMSRNLFTLNQPTVSTWLDFYSTYIYLTIKVIIVIKYEIMRNWPASPQCWPVSIRSNGRISIFMVDFSSFLTMNKRFSVEI